MCVCTEYTHITNARIISFFIKCKSGYFDVYASLHHHYAATVMTMYRNGLMSIKAFLSMFTACHKISLPITLSHLHVYSKQCLIHWMCTLLFVDCLVYLTFFLLMDNQHDGHVYCAHGKCQYFERIFMVVLLWNIENSNKFVKNFCVFESIRRIQFVGHRYAAIFPFIFYEQMNSVLNMCGGAAARTFTISSSNTSS